MTGWLIDIIPQKCPPDVMDTPEPYRAAWERHVGKVTPGDGDPEDWREQAARLEAATRILPDPHVRVAGRSYGGPDPMTLAHYGAVMLRPYMDQLSLPPSNADRYDLMPSLRPFLGRDARSAPCDGDAVDAAVRGMLDRHPGSGAVAKFMFREKRLPLAFIDPDGTFMQTDEFDFLPVLKGGDSYTVRLNEGLRFGGFPFHGRPRCGRLAPTPVLRRLHGRLTTRRVPPRQGCSRPRSSHGRAGHRT